MIKRILSIILIISVLLMIISVRDLTVDSAAADLTISTAQNLKDFANRVNNGETFAGKTVVLTADINLGGSSSNKQTPIGTSSNPFSGTFDGGGHKITGLYIDPETFSSGSTTGLFGTVTNGTIKNLGVDGTVIGYQRVGGIVGMLQYNSTIENCYNACSVSSDSNIVGGVVGYNNQGSVKRCYNTGTVTLINSATPNILQSQVGGVVGSVLAGTVEYCYNTGEVLGINTHSIGGVVGYISSGDLLNCYNTGTVTGKGETFTNFFGVSLKGEGKEVGGIVGNVITVSGIATSRVENCYNIGAVSGETYAGSVLGMVDAESTVKNCYYLDGKGSGGIGKADSPTGSDATGKAQKITSTQLKQQSTFSTWNFSSIWVMSNWIGRPLLRDLSFCVTYDYDDATSGNSTVNDWVENVDKYYTLPAPEKTGCTFDGWYTAATGGTKVTSNSGTITGSHTLYARWKGMEYNITYKDQGGAAFSGTNKSSLPSTHTYGSKTDLIDATKDKYKFEGWYTNSSCTGNPITSIGAEDYTEDITLYAKWTLLSNTVTFNPNGGTLSGDTKKEYDPDKTYGTLPTPTRKGYDFGGWFKNQACTGTAVKSTDTVTDDHTLYAKWTATPYAITYVLDGGTNNSSNPASYTIEDTVTLKDPEKEGHTFLGWYEDAAFNKQVTGISKGTIDAKIFYAKWKIADYNVTYLNGGTIENENNYTSYTYGTGLKLPTAEEIKKTGYTFEGWYKDPAFSGDTVTAISGTDTGDKTFYAKWTANQYTVYFEYNGAYVDETTETERNVTYDSPYGALPTPEKTGHSFDGWYTAESGGDKVIDSDKVQIADDHILYARWSAETYDITYDTKGGEIENADDFKNYEYGKGLTLPTPTRTGYTFNGWYENDDFDGSAVEEISATDTGSKTYYAKWTVIRSKVTLDYQDGTTPDETLDVEYDGTYELPTPERTGYDFDGWFTEESGGNTVTSGDTVTIIEDQILYAHWTAKQFKVTFEYKEAKSGNETPYIMVTYDSTYGELPKPKNPGWSFGGWFTEEDGKGDRITADTEVKITADQSLYESWIECQHEDMTWTDDDDGDQDSDYRSKHHSGTCENCGKDLTEEHNWDDGVFTVEPTPEDEGEKLYTCEDECGATYTEVIPAHAHNYSQWEYDENEHWGKCTIDGATNTPAAHNWDSGKETTPATATEKGEKTFTCTDCGATKTEEIPATGGNSSGDNSSGDTPGGSWGGTLRPSAGTTTPSTGDNHNNPSDNTSDSSTGEAADTSAEDNTADLSTGDNNDPTDGTDDPSTEDNNDPTDDAADPSTGDSTDPSNGNDAGNVNVDSASGENAPNITISEETSSKLKEEAIAEHLTPEEKATVASGDDLDIILMVEDAGDSVPAEDRQVTEAVLTNTEYTIGMYLNIDLIKLINGQRVGKITEISSPINVTVEIPEVLRSANREFVIVRVHNGTAEILEDVDSDPDTITIVTDKFSIYSIAYRDADKSNPYTGAAAPVSATVIACAIIAAAVTVRKRKIIE